MEKQKLQYLKNTLELLFPRKERHRKLTLTMLLEIRNRQYKPNKYSAKAWKDFCQRVGCKEEDYQYVLSNLREWRLVLNKGIHHRVVYYLN